MTIVVVILTALLMLVGLIGSVVPMIPGSVLIFCGALLYAWHTDFVIISWTVIAVLALLTIAAQVIDYLASTLGAKRFGASGWGIAGACIGAIAGFFLGGLVGIIIGPFAGAVAAELITGAGMKRSLKVGYGTLIGFLGGMVGRFAIAVVMVGVFLFKCM
ncbi:MAG: DUF456 domain-containing protein [Deltaproteobacteria bacterium]|nr:DUF456 domain-containing protein [Deltaproteobacteria bacterium]